LEGVTVFLDLDELAITIADVQPDRGTLLFCGNELLDQPEIFAQQIRHKACKGILLKISIFIIYILRE
jgi:hypothetical protein